MGDYIEREAVINRLKKVHMDKHSFGIAVQFGVDHAIKCLEEQPAADVAPVVHAHWGEFQGYFKCSNCGRIVNTSGDLDFIKNMLCLYCPNCGALMDGEPG